jgi:hypothetical protein
MLDSLNIIKNELEEVKKIRNNDSKWSHNRRIVSITLIILVLASYIGFKIWQNLQVESTCIDGVKNGQEKGVDCDGTCELLCKNSFKPLKIIYSNYFKNLNGTYDILTLIENDNSRSAPKSITLKYENYDDFGARGEDFYSMSSASHGNVIPIISRGYKSTTSISRISTEISDYAMYKNEIKYNLRLKDFEFESGSISKLRVNYDSLNNIGERITLLVLLKDNLGNIVNFQTQNIENLVTGGNYTSYYTWNEEIKVNIATITLLPIY